MHALTSIRNLLSLRENQGGLCREVMYVRIKGSTVAEINRAIYELKSTDQIKELANKNLVMNEAAKTGRKVETMSNNIQELKLVSAAEIKSLPVKLVDV